MTVLPPPHPLTPLDHALSWVRQGHAVALATVVGTWGSSPRPAGSLMAISDTGRVEGSVSGGCVETDVITAAQAILAGAPPDVLHYGISSARAWEVGLACGGKLDVMVEAINSPACPSGTLPDSVLAEACTQQNARNSIVLARTLDGAAHVLLSRETLTGVAGKTPLAESFPQELAAAALTSLQSGRCQNETDAQGRAWFLQPLAPPPRLLIVGAVHIAQHLALLARMTGFAPVVIDPRTALATPERFPGFISGETLITEWPDEALEALDVDGMTAIVTLTHDAKLDDPTLEAALRSPAFYIGALGSRTTQASRMARLREAGFTEEAIRRIHGPVGLAIGAVGAEEIALSILAEIVAVRRKSALAENRGW
ncbi:XdhC family protein [Acetobacter farinalis]|uniref:XdhC family protein n=1 Tax=Acetobacter farinalis TaxID=1260984 RepID=A0ABT3Q8K5_9PROT|nr:XdhC/CoxI family protein [Acetobacter farinalis]MCX2561606.1 XdhC family protein [Acetobacter farinalis]NHO30105.1 xanthine dehydrogenase [Acetobacter farinalis]